MVKLSLVYYGETSARASARILACLPEYLVCNTAHGLWGNVNGRSAGWSSRELDAFKGEGVQPVGYITSGYEGTRSGGSIGPQWYSLETNRRLVVSMAKNDGVSGVFIDECSAFPDPGAKAYLKELTRVAHEHQLVAWGNVGQDDFDAWFFTGGGFDFMHSTEQWRGQPLTETQRKFGRRISVTGLGARHTLEDAVRLTLRAWEEGLRYCYVTNSYLSLPLWFEAYVSAIGRGAAAHSVPGA